MGGDEEIAEEAVEAAAVAGLVRPEGEEKKEVIEALAFGFFAVLVAISAALRLRGVVILERTDQLIGDTWKEHRAF